MTHEEFMSEMSKYIGRVIYPRWQDKCDPRNTILSITNSEFDNSYVAIISGGYHHICGYTTRKLIRMIYTESRDGRLHVHSNVLTNLLVLYE